ncbi:hypothetical protein AC1031_020381 [Aphanomyces cochlioides]|nr:hypothetical protein AC1031_020381 [Aphanomyces cochlioides]
MDLFTPLQVGSVRLANRVLMPPLTRIRAGPTHVPNDLMKEYYAQRASAGLIIAECSMIAPKTSAFYGEPGVYTQEQLLLGIPCTTTARKTSDRPRLPSTRISRTRWRSRGELSHHFDLAYVHVMRDDFFKLQKADVVPIFRQHFKNTLIVNMGNTKDEANAGIAAGLFDAVTFGTPFLANPDLPLRLKLDAPLNQPHTSTFYVGGANGYTDYPFLSS